MIDNNTKFTLLFQKTEKTEQKRQRLFVFMLIIPIIFYLINQAIIQEISLSIFNLSQMKIIQFSASPLYSILFFYICVLTEHNSEIIDQINYLFDKKDKLSVYKTDKWLKYIYPMNFLGDVLGSLRAGGFIGALGQLIVFFPLVLLTILYPFIFYLYSLYFNFTSSFDSFGQLPMWAAIFSIWVSVAAIIYMKSKDFGKKIHNKKVVKM